MLFVTPETELRNCHSVDGRRMEIWNYQIILIEFILLTRCKIKHMLVLLCIGPGI